MLPIVLAIVAAAVVIFLIVVATRPGEFRIERSTSINAPANVVFPLVNDFHQWPAWSPWEGKDPNIKRSYDGPPAGTGAVYSWQGNKQVGEGRMTITESSPSALVRLKLEFLKPFAATNIGEFTFRPAGNQTSVTWAMSGKSPFMVKLFSLFMNMDKMVGSEFEKGLAKMKSIAESESQR